MNKLPTLGQLSSRLGYIDAQRGIAALLVLWLHATEVFMQLPEAPSGAWLFDFAWAIDTGRVGVVLFFAISGFVIPSSLGAQTNQTTQQTLKAFLIHRFFRLYPVYWVSVLASGIFGFYVLTPFSWQTVLLNLTMIQSLLGAPDVMGLYWTLRIELLFYGLCVVLFMLRLLRQPHWLAVGLLASPLVFSGLALVAYRVDPASSGNLLNYLPVYGLYLSTMFWSALFRRWHDQVLSNEHSKFSRPLMTIFLGFPICLCLSPLLVLFAAELLPLAYSNKILKLSIPLAIGVGLFVLLSTKLKIENKLCTWLGEISYSMYLFHPLVFYSLFVLVRDGHLARLSGAPLSVYLLLSALGSVALSSVTYYLVEVPAIRLGRKLGLAVSG